MRLIVHAATHPLSRHLSRSELPARLPPRNFPWKLPPAPCRCSFGIPGFRIDWMPGEWTLLSLSRGVKGLKALIAVTLAPHAPAAPLTGPLGENRDKPLLNPQNTFTRDYQIPWTRLLSVWGKAVGPWLCGQNRFNMVSPESTWKDMKSSSGVCTGGFFFPHLLIFKLSKTTTACRQPRLLSAVIIQVCTGIKIGSAQSASQTNVSTLQSQLTLLDIINL